MNLNLHILPLWDLQVRVNKTGYKWELQVPDQETDSGLLLDPAFC